MKRLIAFLIVTFMTGSAAACPFVPPPVRDLNLERFYSDTAGSEIDPELKAEHKRATQPVRKYLAVVSNQADLSFYYPSEGMAFYKATCALEWLRVWAEGGALLGDINGKQSAAERRWTLAGAALAYVKVKQHANKAQSSAIEPWLLKLASAVRADFENGQSKHNNHYYWLGLGLAATSLATGEAALWDEARTIATEAASAIQANGTLPHELARKARALHYHAFALMPLLTLAELAASKGEDWYQLNDGALHRLAALTLKSFNNAEAFQNLTAVAQEHSPKPGAGWVQLYQANFPDRTPKLKFELPTSHSWLGGNVILLKRALKAKP
jgi:poly(beta-D-mannuronate) lyase